jgi:hypothetical protein
MSFSVYLNSINGTQVAGAQSQIQYNFDFTNTPKHDGGYKVSMSFASELQTYIPASAMFGRIHIDLGVLNNFTPAATFTGTRNNNIFGIIRPSQPLMDLTTTASYPINSGTAAFTLITTYTGRQSIDAKFEDNSAVYMPYKSTNNQFIVKITLHDGALYTYLTAHYAMILHFEAV